MKQITEQQAVECMAEMLGKCAHDWRQVVPDAFGVNKSRKRFQCTKCKELCFIRRSSLFNPLHEDKHARQCLEAWRKQGKHRSYRIDSPFRGIESYMVRLNTSQHASHPDPNYAVITALCSAQMGEQVEIEG